MHERFMLEAIELAVSNVRSGQGGPFAALVVRDGEVVGQGTNRVTTSNDPTAHAEISAIRDACASLGRHQLDGCTIYATCEPCPMCMGAIYWARPERVFFAATREHARDAGFDDDYIYRQLALPRDDRSIGMMQVCPDAAQRPFEAWLRYDDRVEY